MNLHIYWDHGFVQRESESGVCMVIYAELWFRSLVSSFLLGFLHCLKAVTGTVWKERSFTILCVWLCFVFGLFGFQFWNTGSVWVCLDLKGRVSVHIMLVCLKNSFGEECTLCFLNFTVSVLLDYLCSFGWLGVFFSLDSEIIHHFGSCSTSWQDLNSLFKVFTCCEITSCWQMVQNIYEITWNLNYSVYMKFSFCRLHKPW